MRRALALLAVVVVAFAATGCSSSGTKSRPAQPPVDLRGHKAVTIDAQDNLFTPPDIVIYTGTTVTWINKDTVPHNIKPTVPKLENFGGTFGVDTASFGPGSHYSFTFKLAGQYYYQCTIHSLMTGHVSVLAPPGTTTTRPKPGLVPPTTFKP